MLESQACSAMHSAGVLYESPAPASDMLVLAYRFDYCVEFFKMPAMGCNFFVAVSRHTLHTLHAVRAPGMVLGYVGLRLLQYCSCSFTADTAGVSVHRRRSML